MISFAGGLPAPELFDLPGLRDAFEQALSDAAGRRSLQYAPTEGNAELRALVAERMTRRGLVTVADDLLITTGSQQALTLVATALLDPGAVVAVEEPTYLAALQCFTGQRRAAVAELAASSGLWVVEDDPYGELRYRGQPLAPLAAHSAAADRVLHLGSFSKIGASGLRLGWVRAPAALRPALTVAKQAADLHTSTIDQAAAACYLAAHDLDEHVRGLPHPARRDARRPAADHPARDHLDRPRRGDVHLAAPARTGRHRLLPEALRCDVAFVPGAAFFPTNPDPATLRLSFTSHPPDEITEGMRRLSAVLHPPPRAGSRRRH